MTGEPTPVTLHPADLFDAAPMALSVLDLDGRMVQANRAHRALFGMGDGPIRDIDVDAISHPSEREMTRAYLHELLSGHQERVQVVKQYVRTDGSVFTGRLTASPLRDAGGRIVGIIGAIEDVSDQRRSRRRAEDQSNRRLEAMLANISDTVTVVDEDGNVLDSTGMRIGILGYGTDFWQERSIFQLVDPDDLPRLLETREEVLRRPGEHIATDVRVRQADDTWADIEVTAVNLLDDPSVSGIVITSRNITPRKQVEAELAARRDEAMEQTRLRSEFVARVSHELRNQLHALQGLTELLSGSDVPRSVRQLADSAHRQADQLKHLVEDLLEYSRIEAGREEPAPRPSWVRQIVADTVSLGAELAQQGVQVVSGTDEDVPDVVLIDAARVRQVMANLISNAAKFTPGGRIAVEVTRCDVDGRPGLRWTVSDTGVGIGAEDLDRIFQPFDQGSSGDRSSGTGLGLAITDRLVTMLGGRIDVTSEPGHGSTFTVEFPVEDTEELPPDQPGGTGRLRAGAHVLVVEDNPVNQMLVAEQLARLGVRATVVGDGLEALELLADGHDVDCVLMDWQLPGLDGVEATRRQRAAEAGGTRVPIIAMTASARPSDRDACLEAGMDEMLVKPVGLQELGAALEQFIGARTAPDAPGDGGAPAADVAALDRLAQDLGSVGPVRSIVSTFLAELDHREAAVDEAVASGDDGLLRRTAHTLRSTSRTLGANDLDRLSEVLEHGPFPPEPTIRSEFVQAAASTRAALSTWLDDHPADAPR
jgi:two-component system sensor histidine kinase/response regulator